MEKKAYLLTGGVVPLIQNRHGIQLSEDTATALRDLERTYVSATQGFLNGRQEADFVWDVRFFSDRVIEEDLGDLVAVNSSPSIPLINFDDVYCQDISNGNYHVTRIQNPHNLAEDPVTGPRLNASPLEEQARIIKNRFGAVVDLIDIGSFGGSTLSAEAKRLRNAGVNVRNIYLMFAGKEAVERLTGEGIDAKYVHSFDWIDWLEIRDCLGLDGRKVSKNGSHSLPDNRFVRYVDNSNRWASIPADVAHHYEGLYHTSLAMIKQILACDGVELSLTQAEDHESVYELRIKKNGLNSAPSSK